MFQAFTNLGETQAMPDDKKLDYVEFRSADLSASKAFFETVFGWKFTDYGPDYTAFTRTAAGLDGGFCRGEPGGGVLMVFYARDIDAVHEDVKSAHADILKPVYDFPGGRRFHFREPGGNELAVWSDPV